MMNFRNPRVEQDYRNHTKNKAPTFYNNPTQVCVCCKRTRSIAQLDGVHKRCRLCRGLK